MIVGKTFQCLAMGRPTIVADNAANAELLTHAEDAWSCRPNDPPALLCRSDADIRPSVIRSPRQGGREDFHGPASMPVP